MLTITKIHARSLDLDFMDISWQTDNTQGQPSGQVDGQHEVFHYTFQVLRSESVGGPWEVISPEMKDTYFFRDSKQLRLNKFRQLFYKVRVKDLRDSTTKDSGIAATFDAEPDLVAMAIQYEESVLFSKVIGRRCWLLPVRTFGPLCTCYDIVTQKVTRSNHLPCFGTGYLGGYLSPIEFFAQIDPTPRSSNVTPVIQMQPQDTTARLQAFPPVKEGDVIVEINNRRWRVLKVSATERLRAIIHQELVIHQIPMGDAEYAIPINIDVHQVQAAEEANFTNKQNLDSDRLEDIFSAYSKPRGAIR